MPNDTKKYAFVLGRERDLCLAELRATLGRFGFCFNPEQSRTGFGDFILSDNVALFNLDKNPAKLIDILGGTTKIFEIVDLDHANIVRAPARTSESVSQQTSHTQATSVRRINKTIEELILMRAKTTSGKFNFGFSAYGRHRAIQLNPLGLNIKKDLKGQLSLRFIALKEKELSTIVSSKNKLATEGLEVGFFNDQVGVLLAVTDPEAWSERDYGKPRGDKFSGMVPPKLARAMVNIALGASINDQVSTINKISRIPLVVDPFCGSGNILLEALMLGCDVLGSDVSEKAVNDSRENVEWLKEKLSSINDQLSIKYQFPKYQLAQIDATSSQLLEHWNLKLDNYDKVVVVCEPYLGEPKKYLSSIRAVRGEYEKVRDLYLNFLKNVAGLNRGGLVVCLVFPLVETVEKTKFSLYSESVDEIKKIGYTELAKPLIYGRDYQVVKREIVLLQF